MFGSWAQKPRRKAHYYEMYSEVSVCLVDEWPEITDRDRDYINNTILHKDKCKLCMDSLLCGMRNIEESINGSESVKKEIIRVDWSKITWRPGHLSTIINDSIVARPKELMSAILNMNKKI